MGATLGRVANERSTPQGLRMFIVATQRWWNSPWNCVETVPFARPSVWAAAQ